jgi:hypothetical protein
MSVAHVDAFPVGHRRAASSYPERFGMGECKGAYSPGQMNYESREDVVGPAT